MSGHRNNRLSAQRSCVLKRSESSPRSQERESDCQKHSADKFTRMVRTRKTMRKSLMMRTMTRTSNGTKVIRAHKMCGMKTTGQRSLRHGMTRLLRVSKAERPWTLAYKVNCRPGWKRISSWSMSPPLRVTKWAESCQVMPEAPPYGEEEAKTRAAFPKAKGGGGPRPITEDTSSTA